MRKHGFRAFGLSLMAVLGLMAFSAVAAQAANLSDGGVSAEFLVLLKALTGVIGATGTQIGSGTLLVPGRNVDILCTAADVLEGKLLSPKEGLAKILFLNCTTWENVALEKVHTVELPCFIPGKDITATAILLPKLHEGKGYVLAEPDGTKDFTVFSYEKGTGCPLPLSVLISGSVVAEVELADATPNYIKFNEEIQKLFQVGELGDHLKYGEFEAYVDALAEVKLTGEHANCPFGIS